MYVPRHSMMKININANTGTKTFFLSILKNVKRQMCHLYPKGSLRRILTKPRRFRTYVKSYSWRKTHLAKKRQAATHRLPKDWQNAAPKDVTKVFPRSYFTWTISPPGRGTFRPSLSATPINVIHRSLSIWCVRVCIKNRFQRQRKKNPLVTQNLIIMIQ